MSTDRELLEAAAKAAGLHIEDDRGDFRVVEVDGDEFFMTDDIWNPLIDDGDALRLAVKLQIDVTQYDDHVVAWFDGGLFGTGRIEHGDDPYAATRRCIVLAAASMAPQPALAAKTQEGQEP